MWFCRLFRPYRRWFLCTLPRCVTDSSWFTHVRLSLLVNPFELTDSHDAESGSEVRCWLTLLWSSLQTVLLTHRRGSVEIVSCPSMASQLMPRHLLWTTAARALSSVLLSPTPPSSPPHPRCVSLSWLSVLIWYLGNVSILCRLWCSRTKKFPLGGSGPGGLFFLFYFIGVQLGPACC